MSTKRKATAKIAAPVVRQSAKAPTKSWVNEAEATVTASAPLSSIQTIEISSDSDFDEASDGEEASDDEQAPANQNAQPDTSNGDSAAEDDAAIIPDGDTEMLSPPQKDDEDTSDAELAAPSFGDLLRSHEVDVANALAPQQQPTPDAQIQPRTLTLAPPSLSSLGTVLTQALRTDDNDLLESCLHTTELKVVQNTIARMDSSLAGILLSKLAARMHRRPGRAHSLMSWVQWTLVAHGGALSTEADVVKKLSDLNRVLEERARGLNSLLLLKGKLDMLEAQMQLRRDNRKAGAGTSHHGALDDDEEDNEQGIIYVEGEEDVQVNGVKSGRRGEDDDFLITNGAADSDDDEENGDDGMDVDEVSVLDVESLDEDEVDHDDIEESGEEDDSDVEPAAPPSKMQKTSKAFGKRK